MCEGWLGGGGGGRGGGAVLRSSCKSFCRCLVGAFVAGPYRQRNRFFHLTRHLTLSRSAYFARADHSNQCNAFLLMVQRCPRPSLCHCILRHPAPPPTPALHRALGYKQGVFVSGLRNIWHEAMYVSCGGVGFPKKHDHAATHYAQCSRLCGVGSCSGL